MVIGESSLRGTGILEVRRGNTLDLVDFIFISRDKRKK